MDRRSLLRAALAVVATAQLRWNPLRAARPTVTSDRSATVVELTFVITTPRADSMCLTSIEWRGGY